MPGLQRVQEALVILLPKFTFDEDFCPELQEGFVHVEHAKHAQTWTRMRFWQQTLHEALKQASGDLEYEYNNLWCRSGPIWVSLDITKAMTQLFLWVLSA